MNRRMLRNALYDETRDVDVEPPVAAVKRRMRNHDVLHATKVSAMVALATVAVVAVGIAARTVDAASTGDGFSETRVVDSTASASESNALPESSPREPAEPAPSTTLPATTMPPTVRPASEVEIAILNPDPDEVVVVPLLSLRGTMTTDASVTVNGIATETSAGRWQLEVPVPIGTTPVTVLATLNDSTEALTFDLVRLPPAENVPWSVSPPSGSSNEFPPVASYRGTAPPGTVVLIRSPYGGGSATANDRGDWWRKVAFDDNTPFSEPFDVIVSSELGSEEFTFVRPD